MRALRSTFRQLAPMFGVDVDGVDLAALVQRPHDETIDELRRLLTERELLRFRGQRLTGPQLVAFTALFGPVKALRAQVNLERGASHGDTAPEIKLISNRTGYDGKPLGDAPFAEEFGWHHDGAYLTNPVSYTILYCTAAPSVDPPRTSWISLREVFDALSEAQKREFARLRLLHYSATNPTKHLPAGAPMVGECRAVAQPFVRVIPENGKATLFYPRKDHHIPVVRDGERWTQEQSAAFREQIFALAERLGHPWSTALQPGDLVLWDNRSLMHRRDPLDLMKDRELWLTSVEGEVPIPWIPS